MVAQIHQAVDVQEPGAAEAHRAAAHFARKAVSKQHSGLGVLNEPEQPLHSMFAGFQAAPGPAQCSLHMAMHC